MAMAQEIQDESALVETYEALWLLAVDAARQGEMEDVWRHLGKIEKGGWQPSLPQRADQVTRDVADGSAAAAPRLAHISVALELIDRGQMQEALHALLQMRRLWAAGAAALASGAPHGIVMIVMAKIGNARATLSLLAEVKAQGLPVTSVEYNHALSACANAAGRNGDGYLSEARALFEELLQTESRPNLVNYSIYVKMLARHGDVEEARGVLRRMEKRDAPPDIISYNTYMGVLAPHGQKEEALRVLREMNERRVGPDATWYGTLLAACGAAGQWPVALYLYSEAVILLGADRDGPSGNKSMQGEGALLRSQLKVLEQSGVDSLFATRAYGEAARLGCVSHWIKKGSFKALAIPHFTRAMAKAALDHVLEHDLMVPFAPSAADESLSQAVGTIRPLTIFVGRGRGRKEEVQRFLATLDPPLHAVSPAHYPDRLVVSAGQFRAYVKAQQRRRRQQSGRL